MKPMLPRKVRNGGPCSTNEQGVTEVLVVAACRRRRHERALADSPRSRWQGEKPRHFQPCKEQCQKARPRKDQREVEVEANAEKK